MSCFEVIDDKTSLPKNKPQMSDLFHDITEGPERVLSMADNENSTSW